MSYRLKSGKRSRNKSTIVEINYVLQTNKSSEGVVSNLQQQKLIMSYRPKDEANSLHLNLQQQKLIMSYRLAGKKPGLSLSTIVEINYVLQTASHYLRRSEPSTIVEINYVLQTRPLFCLPYTSTIVEINYVLQTADYEISAVAIYNSRN